MAATAIGADVADSISGTASGVLNTGAQLGTAIGVAALLLLAAGVAGTGGGLGCRCRPRRSDGAGAAARAGAARVAESP